MDIDPIRTDPVGDDPPFNRDVQRAIREIIAQLASQDSRISQVEGRVN